MFYSTLFISATAFCGLVSAQNFSYNGPYTVDPGTVDPDTRISWCRGQTPSCQSICGGATDQNSCDPTTLDYKCVCTDGSKPNISDYGQTIPSFECQQWFQDCITASGTDLSLQNKCLSVACGSKNASAVPQTGGSEHAASSSSASASASASASKTGGGGGSSKATSTGAAAALNVGKSYGTGILAGAMLAVFGLAL